MQIRGSCKPKPWNSNYVVSYILIFRLREMGLNVICCLLYYTKLKTNKQTNNKAKKNEEIEHD